MHSTTPHPSGEGSSARQRFWRQRVAELREAVERLGRFPEAGDFIDGGALGGHTGLQAWIRNQRRRDLDDDQIATLNSIPGFSWTPRDDAWEQRLHDYRTWALTHDRFPRYRSDDSIERRLADWITRQRRHLKRGLLPHRQAMMLRHLMPPDSE